MRTRRSNREKHLALLTAFLVVGATVYAFVMEPQWSKRKALIERRASAHLRLTKIQNDMRLKDYIDKTFKSMAALVAGESNENQEMSSFSRELRELYTGLSLKRQSIRPLPVIRERYYRVLAMKVELEGNVKWVLDFIGSVERLPAPVSIRSCELKAQEMEDIVQASLVICKIVATSET